MQPYNRYFSWIEQVSRLIYDYYAVHAFGSICHYFHINPDASVYDNDKLKGGSYEFYGDITGIRFTKILLLPVFFVEPIQPTYVGEERGYIHETESSIVIPSAYEFIPLEHDLLYFPSNLNPSINYPIYEVTGIEKASDTSITMFRCRIRSARTSYEVVDNQVVELKVWVEPAKKIFPYDRGLYLYKLLDIIDDLVNDLQNNVYVTGQFGL